MKPRHILIALAAVACCCVASPFYLLLGIVAVGDSISTQETSQQTQTRRESPFDIRRSTHETKLLSNTRDTTPMPVPPPSSDFSLVKYPTDIGDMSAYLCIPSGDVGKDADGKRPAIIWITGGFPPGGGGSFLWGPVHPDNDQAATAYRKLGFIMMYPALRGAAGNPGVQETFYGEVDDVIAAGRYLQNVEGVDPERVYLGGHSTGGTLVLLVAATTDLFREVISFGPIDNPANYGMMSLTYAPFIEAENGRRSPINFMNQIKSPTRVYEGGKNGNADALRNLAEYTDADNEMVSFQLFSEYDHFSVLGPVNEYVAKTLIDEAGQNDLTTPEPQQPESQQ